MIAIENLPAYEAISNEPIRTAVAELNAAKAAREQARKDLVELEQTREAAEWKDAECAAKARSEGKPEPKRVAVAAHDRKTDEARHELKVAELAQRGAHAALAAALTEHGAEWAAEVERDREEHLTRFHDRVTELVGVHARLSAALAVSKAIGQPRPGVGAIQLTRRQIQNVEFASGQAKVPAVIFTGDVLAALAELGQPAPEAPPREPAQTIRIGEDRTAQAGIRREVEERREWEAATRERGPVPPRPHVKVS